MDVVRRRSGRVPTGLFIRAFLLEREAHPSEIHRALHLEYDKVNQGRPRRERLKPPTWHSFLRHLHQMKQFGLVDLSGREEPIEESEVPWLTEGVVRYYRLTDKGRAEPPHDAWVNWRRIWEEEGYPELEVAARPPSRPPEKPTPPPEKEGLLESVISKWAERKKNISLLKKDLETLRETYSLEDVDDAVEEYEGIVREDYETTGEYQEERDDAWQKVLDTLENAEEEEALE